jgi:hypothetical protein
VKRASSGKQWLRPFVELASEYSAMNVGVPNLRKGKIDAVHHVVPAESINLDHLYRSLADS